MTDQNTNKADFSNWDGDFPASELTAVSLNFQPQHKKAPAKAPGAYVENCDKCRGKGRFISWSGRDVGACHRCKGTGKLRFHNPKEVREQQRAARAARKAKKAVEAVEAFKEAHPVEFEWLVTSSERGFGFAVSLLDALQKYGKLTEKQFAAVQKCVAKQEARKAERKAIEENAPTVNIDAIATAFQTALESGLKRPKLRLADFLFSLAPASGKNAGAVYVKRMSDDEYLGKIPAALDDEQDHRFVRAYGCDEETEAKVVEVCAAPDEAAVAYGKMTGSCACCGRELTNAESVERGIGPICATKFGW